MTFDDIKHVTINPVYILAPVFFIRRFDMIRRLH